MAASDPTPLLLEPILKEKVWGGRRLERLGKALPPRSMVGESWELADLGTTEAGGGGGGAARSRIATWPGAPSPHAGCGLHELIDAWGDALVPRGLLTPSGDFPLLVKFLDAREHLSIQVHPSPAYAATHPGAHLKTECWYVLDAASVGEAGGGEPAVIYKGLRPGVTAADLRQLIALGRVPEAMLTVPAVVGQMHDLPSGTCHALGAGVLVAEVQTPSDTTYRLYDWAKEYGRQGRSLHVEEAMACIDFGPAPAAMSLPAGERAGPLVRNAFYAVDELRPAPGAAMVLPDRECQVLLVIGGRGRMRSGGAWLPLRSGDTVVLPAAVAAGTEIEGLAGSEGDNRFGLLRVRIGAGG